jgi:hypothetical protein
MVAAEQDIPYGQEKSRETVSLRRLVTSGLAGTIPSVHHSKNILFCDLDNGGTQIAHPLQPKTKLE